MRINNHSAAPRWFWTVAWAGLVWTLIGVTTYVASVTTTDDALLRLSEAERTLIESVPPSITGAYAIAVFAGVFGCLALLLRRRWAILLLTLSLAAILVQMGFTLLMSEHLQVYGPTGAIVPMLVIAAAAYLAWFSRMARARGWLS